MRIPSDPPEPEPGWGLTHDVYCDCLESDQKSDLPALTCTRGDVMVPCRLLARQRYLVECTSGLNSSAANERKTSALVLGFWCTSGVFRLSRFKESIDCEALSTEMPVSVCQLTVGVGLPVAAQFSTNPELLLNDARAARSC